MEKVLVLNSKVLGYQVIRALGEKGIKTIVLYDEDKYEIGIASKYVVQAFRFLDFQNNTNELVTFLKNRKEQWKGTLIIPTNDFGVEFLAENKDTLASHYVIPTPDGSLINKIVNKVSLYKFAEKRGVGVPQIFTPSSYRELEAIKDEISYPCLLKPGLGYTFFKQYNCKMIQVNNYSELLFHFRKITDDFTINEHDLMISEIIPGSDSENMVQYVSYRNNRGQLLARMASRKIRSDPPGYGQSRVAKSICSQDVEITSNRLLQELGYNGFSEIEWKQDPRDGVYKLIEINPRFIFYLALCGRCGINFPYILYQELVKKKDTYLPEYRKNVYWIHLYKDILHTWKNRKDDNCSLLDYLKPYYSSTKVFAVFNLADINPFLKQWLKHVGNMIKKISIIQAVGKNRVYLNRFRQYLK